jgi:hypothetical protein
MASATISRHSGAPFEDGEELLAADLETDVANAFVGVNGGLGTDNFTAAAGFTGDQFRQDSVAADRFGASVLPLTKIKDDMLWTVASETSSGNPAQVLGASVGTWTAVPVIGSLSITPTAQTHKLLLSFRTSLRFIGVNSSGVHYYNFIFVVDGERDTDAQASISLSANAGDDYQPLSMMSVYDVTSTLPKEISVEYAFISAGGAGGATRIPASAAIDLHAFSIPGK